MSDRLVRFPGTSWQQIEALPRPLRWTVALIRRLVGILALAVGIFFLWLGLS